MLETPINRIKKNGSFTFELISKKAVFDEVLVELYRYDNS